ncbi:hypothetical protein F503_05758 [Ophiostoma piceae UAMH 11346]|uniref:Uncharacterized protein n=1 Tax=Ophiostoma piceae (strain UAMH 11346) TaxID=1262450 RepID=S3CVC3_OPHP1|nr:hypothetical protein F503_05758 [Ophiostoma piceae UAMH 11346]
MSSPALSGPSAPSKEKTGVGRMLTRMKTIMKRAEKRMSISGPSKATPSTAKSASAEPAAAAEAGPSGSAANKTKAKKTDAAFPDAMRVPRMQLHEERARKLGERFGLEILPSEWHSIEGDALRVNKPIRMRVHRTCHECKTDFGTAKQCPKCDHVRCTQCARYPPKRTEAEKLAARERRAQVIKEQKELAPIIADWDAPKKVFILSRPSKSGGQDLVYKKPRQRLRRNCCQCDKLFVGGSKACSACSHARCTDCPRDPAKKDKYPYGYPGDVFGARSVPRYKCHQCKAKYPVAAPEGTACTKCSHARCVDCPRLKPQRVDPEPDPEILKTIEARLAQLKVG